MERPPSGQCPRMAIRRWHVARSRSISRRFEASIAMSPPHGQIADLESASVRTLERCQLAAEPYTTAVAAASRTPRRRRRFGSPAQRAPTTGSAARPARTPARAAAPRRDGHAAHGRSAPARRTPPAGAGRRRGGPRRSPAPPPDRPPARRPARRPPRSRTRRWSRARRRRDGRAPPGSSPAGCGRSPVAARRGMARSDGAASACTSSRIGRVPSMAGSSTEPGPDSASPANADDGSATGCSPASVISKMPTSLVDPNRFLTARRHHAGSGSGRPRTGAPRRPGARAPAARPRSPSLVTCPTSTIVTPWPLATRASRSAASRTCATLPGAEVRSLRVQGLHRVDHAHTRRLATIVSQTASSSVSASDRDAVGGAQPLGPQPHLGRRLLAGHQQHGHARRPRSGEAPGAAASSCRPRARRRSAPATRARALRRAPGRTPPDRCRSATHPPAPPRPAAAPGGRPAGAAGGRAGTSSISVFHSPQPGHGPATWGLVAALVQV